MATEIQLDNYNYTTENASSKENSNMIKIEVYTVTINCILVGLVVIPGVVANLYVLLSTRCKKSIRCLQYGLHYTLFVINLLMCLIWLPLHVIQNLVLYTGQYPHAAICYISTALFHLCLGSMAFLSISLGVLHLNHLSTSPVQAIRALVSRSIIASLATALLLTALVLTEQPFNLAHDICATGSTLGVNSYKFWYSFVSLLLSIAYTAILLIIVVLLWLAMQAIRQRIGEMLEQTRKSHQQSDSIEDYPDDTYEISREEPSKHSSVTFKEPEISDTPPNKNGGIARTNSPSPKALRFKCAKEKDSDEDEDDEMFEKKMRMRMQKTSGSGRRHTVANIGLGDSFLASKRRGSLEVPQRSPHNYNYVRKWSVDITALQAQLENPRHNTGSFRFNDSQTVPETAAKGSNRELHSHEEEDEENECEKTVTDKLINETSDETPRENNNMGNGNNTTHKTNDVNNTNVLADNTNTQDAMTTQNDVNNVSDVNNVRTKVPLLTHVPSIIVDENTQNYGSSKDPETSLTQPADPQEVSHVDDDILRKFHKQLRKTKHYITFYLLTLLLILPYCIVQMFQSVLGPHLSINLTYVTASLCVVNTMIQPLWLAWIDTRLRGAMRRLWNKMTQWKCVCYCNIGKGKNFFGKPVELDENIQTDFGSNVC